MTLFQHIDKTECVFCFVSVLVFQREGERDFFIVISAQCSFVGDLLLKSFMLHKK